MAIYFMQSVDGGPVKIGFSTDVDRRREELEGHYGQPLAILAVIEGDRTVERAMHSRFSHLRLGKKEQFRPAADLMAFIGRPLLVGANSETVEAMSGNYNSTQIRLAEADRDMVAAIQERFGLPSAAAAIRYAIDRMHRNIEPRKHPTK